MIENELVPKHEILPEEEVQPLLEKYQITKEQLPKISLDDPGIIELEPKVGDIIRIMRNSEHIGNSIYFRVVIE